MLLEMEGAPTAAELEKAVRGGIPVRMKGALAGARALERWRPAELKARLGDRRVRLKTGYVADGKTATTLLRDYVESLERFDDAVADGISATRPAYLHDVPLTSVIPDVPADVACFPVDLLPAFYRAEGWKFARFFLGPSSSVTPLHFDCLLTHNLFFQISGKKRFTLIASEDQARSYIYQWRWSRVDPEKPDLESYPRYGDVRPVTCIVEPGDALYIPPGTLHHVRSLETSVSFNIDWHTPESSRRGVLAFSRGMPWKNVYYNAVIAAGLHLPIPRGWVFPLYASYLQYVS
jgi:hypothetical protein